MKDKQGRKSNPVNLEEIANPKNTPDNNIFFMEIFNRRCLK